MEEEKANAGLAEVEGAQCLLREHLRETPLLTSSSLDALVGCHVLFKAEHLQKTGSFKARGALFNALRLSQIGASSIVTHSSGNHGQAVAWAARVCHLPATVVVPSGAPRSKTQAIRAYGAELVECDNSIIAREEECARQATLRGAAVVEPFDAWGTLVGQGTVGVELRRQTTLTLDGVFIATGGGGLAGGIALALPDITLFLVEPEGKELAAQLAGNATPNKDPIHTMADGIRVRQIGKRNKDVLRAHGRVQVITVSEEEIREALILIWTRLKQRVEPSAAVPFAGLRQLMASPSPPPLHNVAVILCGGNVDHEFLP